MFTLFNKELKRFLKHPKDGLWASENNEEAQELLKFAKEYVVAIGYPEISDQLTIVEISSDKV